MVFYTVGCFILVWLPNTLLTVTVYEMFHFDAFKTGTKYAKMKIYQKFPNLWYCKPTQDTYFCISGFQFDYATICIVFFIEVWSVLTVGHVDLPEFMQIMSIILFFDACNISLMAEKNAVTSFYNDEYGNKYVHAREKTW